MRLAGPTYHLAITGTKLTGRVTLKIPAARSGTGVSAGPQDAMLAYFDTATHRWQPVNATYSAGHQTLTAVSPHLSVWSALRLNVGKVETGLKNLLTGFLGVANVTQPSCAGSGSLTADGVKVVSDSGSRVKWCAGISAAGSPDVEIVNNRDYAVETDYPSTWAMQRTGPSDSVSDRILELVSRALSPQPAGQAAVVMPGGHAAELTVPPGTSGLATVAPSAQAVLASAFAFGAQTLAMTFDDVPGAPAASTTKTAAAVQLVDSSASCLSSMEALLRNKATSASDVGDLFRADTELAVGCLGHEWETAYGEHGLLASFVTSVILWLADGVKLIVDDLDSLVENSFFFGDYRLAVESTGPPCTAAAFAPAGLSSDERFTMLHFACLDGYALAVGNLSFTGPGASGPEGGVATFRDSGGKWVIMEGYDDGTCLLGTVQQCGGLARPAGSEPPHQILVELVHKAGLTISSNGADIAGI